MVEESLCCNFMRWSNSEKLDPSVGVNELGAGCKVLWE